MKKTKSMVMGAAILAALTLPMTAMAANKLVVRNAGDTADAAVVTDAGWIGSGTNAPVGPYHLITTGASNTAAGNILQLTTTGATPGVAWAPNFTLMRNNDVSVNAGLPRQGDALGFFNFGSVFSGTRTNRALIYAFAEKNWTSTLDSPAYFQFLLNPGGVTQNREVLTINSNGTMKVNGGIRLWPYTGTTPNPALVPTRPATCDASVAGTMWFTKAATGGTDTLSICAEIGGVFAWKNVTFN